MNIFFGRIRARCKSAISSSEKRSNKSFNPSPGFKRANRQIVCSRCFIGVCNVSSVCVYSPRFQKELFLSKAEYSLSSSKYSFGEFFVFGKTLGRPQKASSTVVMCEVVGLGPDNLTSLSLEANIKYRLRFLWNTESCGV